MAVTVDSLLESYPEADGCQRAHLQTLITRATERVDADTWGENADDGVMAWAMHLLASGPWGNQHECRDPQYGTTYGRIFADLRRSMPTSDRVVT